MEELGYCNLFFYDVREVIVTDFITAYHRNISVMIKVESLRQSRRPGLKKATQALASTHIIRKQIWATSFCCVSQSLAVQSTQTQHKLYTFDCYFPLHVSVIHIDYQVEKLQVQKEKC
jgi:hypothetical protein